MGFQELFTWQDRVCFSPPCFCWPCLSLPHEPAHRSAEAENSTTQSYLFCFWNVENLFDDRDDGRTGPGDKEYDDWFADDPEVLKLKLDHLTEALLRLNDGNGPDILAWRRSRARGPPNCCSRRSTRGSTDPALHYQHVSMKDAERRPAHRPGHPHAAARERGQAPGCTASGSASSKATSSSTATIWWSWPRTGPRAHRQGRRGAARDYADQIYGVSGDDEEQPEGRFPGLRRLQRHARRPERRPSTCTPTGDATRCAARPSRCCSTCSRQGCGRRLRHALLPRQVVHLRPDRRLAGPAGRARAGPAMPTRRRSSTTLTGRATSWPPLAVRRRTTTRRPRLQRSLPGDGALAGVVWGGTSGGMNKSSRAARHELAVRPDFVMGAS